MHGISLQHLRFLAALRATGHFGQAAEACFVSQSTLSAGIATLEAQLGVKVAERTKRQVRMTPIGLDLATRADNILLETESFVTAAKAAQRPFSNPISLGAIPTIGPYLLPNLLTPLRNAFPNLPLYLQEMQTAPLIDAIEAGSVDMGLLALPYPLPDTFETHVLGAESFLLACGKGHELNSQKPLPPSSLDRDDLLLLEDGHCLRDHALGVCSLSAHARRRDPRFQATSLTTLMHMAEGGLGVTLVPAMARHEAERLGLCLRPLTHNPIGRQIALVWRKSSPRDAEIRALTPHMQLNKKGRT